MNHSTKLFCKVVAAMAAAVTVFAAAEKLADDNRTPDRVVIERDRSELDRSGKSGLLTSYADVLDNVTPAVVSINVERKRTYARRNNSGPVNPMEELLRRFYGLPPRENSPRMEPETIERFELEGTGSGFIVSADGYILTNHHVIAGRYGFDPEEDADFVRITVELKDGREYRAEVVGSEQTADVAVLKIESDDDLPVAVLGDSDQIRVGDIAFAVGNPLRVGLTVSQGIISALNRTDIGIIDRGLREQGERLPALENFIQTDAAINMGNSGGPLVDAQGRVVGINSAISSIGGGSIGIGFAIPVNLALRIMQTIVTDGEISRGFIGIEMRPLDADTAKGFGLKTTKGVIISSVSDGLPADLAGLRRGDVILSVDGERVDSVRDMVYLISSREPGETVALEVFRYGERMTVDVTLGNREALLAGKPFEAGGEDSISPDGDTVIEGLRVSPVTEDAVKRYGYAETPQSGLLVIAVEASDAFVTTIEPGMTIVEINGQGVESAEQARSLLKRGGNVVWAMLPDGTGVFVPLNLP